jgi:YVTN family beta-propeller protein
MVRPMTWYWLFGLGLATAGCGDNGGLDTANFGTDGSVSGGTTGGADTGGQQPTTGEPPPEVEDEGDFRVPRASGKYVYTASKTTDSVAVIDTATLVIDVVEVGQGPTVVQPIPGEGGDAGGAVVLDQGSDDVAVLRTSEAGVTSVALHKVTAGANNLAVAPGGAYAFVYHDVDGPEQLGPGSDQELTVLDLKSGEAHSMTVGAHPREVVFATDDTRAWVITAAGVNVIEFSKLGEVGKPPLVPVIGDPGIDPATLEVQVAASKGVALARVDGAPWLAVTDLASGVLTVIDLPGSPTDLDVAPAGEFAVMTIPGAEGSSFLELPLPLVGGGAFEQHAVDGEYVGQTAVADSGDTMLLFTTVNPFARTAGPPTDLQAPEEEPLYASTGSTGDSSTGDGSGGTTGALDTSTGDDSGGEPHADPRQRITLARRGGADWSLVTLFVEVPVASVGIAPDSRNAILVHAEDPASPMAAFSYSLFDVTPDFPLLKRQTTQAPPGPVLFTPDGERAAVLLRDDAAKVRKVDMVDLGNFIVEPLLLGSPPEGAGHVDATDKIFVSQEHPTGRITFVSAAGEVQTVTGYVLNDSVKD